METRILGIAGSLRRASYNRALLAAAAELAPHGMAIEPFDLLGVPVYNADDEAEAPARATELRARIRAADGVLLVTPEYNYSISGALKNAIDWGSQPVTANTWNGKLAAILGASISSIGTARAQLHLRQVLASLNVAVLPAPELLVGRAKEKFDADLRLTDEKTRACLRGLLEEFARWISKLRA
jgi:chromate reductase